MPVSLIGTFVFFPLLGFSINTLSLFGLVLAIGLVVDDAIVVVEAIEQHIEQGLSPREATLQAMEEVLGAGRRHRAGAVVGVHPGRLHGRHHRVVYQQFALTIAISVLHLGLQRAHADARRFARCCCGRGGKRRAGWRASSAGSTAGSSGRRTATSASRAASCARWR